MRAKEGRVSVLGYKLFYRQFGTPSKGEVLGLHGGPGATHDYLLSLADLAKHGYRVTLYDQLGCGRSELPKDVTLFVPERYIEELEEFRGKMRLGRPHIIGSSWGGMLAIAYALKYQKNMATMTTVGGLHSVPMTSAGMKRMENALPKKVRDTLHKYQAAGDYENPAYMEAAMVFYKKHLCRLPVWPKDVAYSLEHISKPVYGTMNGPNEFTIIGNIRYWDVTDQLHKIKAPSLILTGKYDEVEPAVGADIHKHIKGSEFTVFPNSSHLAMWEERESFMKRVLRFLSKHPS